MPLSAERKIYIPPDNDILSVTPHPLLEQDLSFRGVDTQYSTHSIHPYVAAINPPLVSELIKYFVQLMEVSLIRIVAVVVCWLRGL